MLNNNNKGNPYHDKSGRFTSKGNQGVGGGEKKPEVNPQKVLSQMKIDNNDIRNVTYEAKRDLAYKGGWKPDKEGNPKNDVDHFLINRAIENIKKGYGVGDESPVNEEWAEDLAYQLKTDGVPEEAIPGLLDTFKAEALSWKEANQKANKKYDYITITRDGSDGKWIDGQVELDGMTPIYGEGDGGDEFTINVDLTDLMDLMYDYMTPEEQEHYNNETITPAFVDEMINKYFDKADADNNNWLYQQFVDQYERNREDAEPEPDEDWKSRFD